VVVPRPRFVIVIGTFGKTTTSRVVRAALDRPPLARRMPTRYTGITDKILITRPSQKYAVLEVGVDGFDQMAPQARVVQPDVVVVTCVASEHHRTFQTLEATRAEKVEMLKALPASGTAVLNGDDPNVMWMAGRTRARVVTYGMGPENDVRATDVEFDWPHGMRFRVHFGWEQRPARCRLIGEHTVYNVLAAVAVGLSEGLEPDRVLARVASVPPTVGRMQPVGLANGAVILRDDFKSATETVEASLAALARIPARRRFAVLGEVTEPVGSMGPLYRRIGAIAAGVADRLVLFGPTARKYGPGARRAGMDPAAIASFRRDMGRVIDLLRAELGPGDVVLIKGRHDQRLDRITLALTGREVRCWIRRCRMRGVQCDTCPLLLQDRT
jgi:UDP-N-acetylmuramoyl-tripeptide--D-alanyl-D-alanine ligase